MAKEKTAASPAPAKTMSVPEFGRLYFGMSEPTAYAAAHRGEFPVIRIGKLMRVPIVAAEAMMRNARPLTEPTNE
jgi:hypothetical protein